MKISETQAVILERLIEAMETDIALPARIGPKAFGSAMPVYWHDTKEAWAMEVDDAINNKGAHFRRVRDESRRQTERRARCSRERISRMEEAFDWIRKAIWDEESRMVLLAYAEVKARGWEWDRYLSNRNRRNPAKKAWIKRTVQRWIVKSLQLIEINIDKDAIILRGPATLHVAHEAAETGGKSISSDLHAWRAEKWKPVIRADG